MGGMRVLGTRANVQKAALPRPPPGSAVLSEARAAAARQDAGPGLRAPTSPPDHLHIYTVMFPLFHYGNSRLPD